MNKQRAGAEIFGVWCGHTGALPRADGQFEISVFSHGKPSLWLVSAQRGSQKADTKNVMKEGP